MIERFALVTALTGIIILMLLSNILVPEIIEISSINKGMLDKKISIIGNITSVRNLENMEILTVKSLNDDSIITVVLFDKLEIEKGVASITGKVREYKGKIEIEAEEITKE